MTWTDGPLLGFDTETTGVDTDHDRIVTAALVRRDRDGTHVRTWLVDPGVEIPEGASAIHGISTEHAREHGVEPRGALEEIATAIADAVREGVPVVAYNASFDLCLLESELRRHDLPTVEDRLGGELRPVIDPLVLDRAEDRYRSGKRKLVDLCGVYQVVDTGSLHTADVDVVATLDVLERIVGRFPHLGDLDLVSLHDYQVTAHRAWAEAFNAWRSERGRTGPGAESTWPSRAASRAAAAAGAPATGTPLEPLPAAVPVAPSPAPAAPVGAPAAAAPAPVGGLAARVTGRFATQPALPVPVTPEPVAIRHDPARDRRFAGRPIQDTLIA
ncbi:exonuclease domain-containing protein [Cellulomonas sp. IC4_254]|uniref:exonuclease domain-containing protein n=1 Tax=Cellulomonas sp. IC4_254 TaxID=2714040 RepID=UPI00141EE407|nr:DNA polymerase III subunit epsilon [Cellulomonas sp. IC4_254]